MATSRATLIRRHFRQRFGIAAPRVGVRSEVQWYWRALLWIVVLSFSIAAANWIYDAGRQFAGYDRGVSEQESAALRAQVQKLTAELASVGENARALEGRLQVEISTIEQLNRQLKQSQRDNAAMKEELALFEGLVSASTAATESVKIAKVRLEAASVPDRYRFGVLLVRQMTAKGGKEWGGELQFSLKIRRPDGDAMISIPGEGNPAASYYRFSVRHLHRAEGEFSLPVGAVLLGGEVRILQDGVIKLRQPITL